MKVGLSIKPKTELNDHIFKMLDNNLIDLILIMTVGNFNNYILFIYTFPTPHLLLNT